MTRPLRHRLLRPVADLVLGQRPRHDLSRAAARPDRERATTCCSSSATCPGTPPTATCRSRTSATWRSTTASTTCWRGHGGRLRRRRRGDRRLLRARGRSTLIDRLAAMRPAAALLLRHRHAGDARRAGARRRGIPRAAGRSRSSTSTSPSPAARCSTRLERGLRGAQRAVALYCSVDPDRYRPTGEAARMGPRLSRHLQPRPPAGAGAAADRARARACRDRRFVVAGPQYPARHRLAGQRRADRASAAGRTRRLLQPPALHAERHPRRHDRGRAGRPACGCSRPPPAARRSSATAGAGSTSSSPRARRSASPTRPRTWSALLTNDRRRPPRTDRAGRRARIVLADHTGRARAARAGRPPSADRPPAPRGRLEPIEEGQPMRDRSRHRSVRKRILVAGGAGFLGSHLCEALLGAGHRVICLDSFLHRRARRTSARWRTIRASR